MANVYQRTVTFEDVTATPTSQVLGDFVIAMDFGGAESLTPVTPVGATDITIATITLGGADVQVTAAALADLNL